MSLFDDYIADIQFANDFPFGVPNEYWHSKDGDILVSEMTEQHIKNCMKKVGEDDAWYPYFQKELARRKAEMRKAEMSKDFIEDEIYPLTITADRYTGTYSGGAYIAWNLDADEVPSEIYYDDCGCHKFWLKNNIICGKGRTVSEALANLYIKLKGGTEQ